MPSRRTLFVLSAIISLFNLVSACNTESCVNDAVKNIGDYVECDMCVCDQACNLNRDDELYQCSIKVGHSRVNLTLHLHPL
jgi:hypothetical protein